MKGGKKNTNKGEKIEELIFRLSLKDDFEIDVQKIRDRYKIPKPGTSSKKPNLTKQNLLALYKDTIDLAQKYKFPSASFKYFLGYILIEQKISFKNLFKESELECTLLDPNEKLRYGKENQYKEAGIYFNTLLITQYASKEDVLRYIESNWNKIKAFREKSGVSKKKIRPTKYKARNKRICELWRLPKEELGIKKGETREVVISRKIKEEFGPPQMNPDTIRAQAKICKS